MKGKGEVGVARQLGTLIVRRLGVARQLGDAQHLGDQM